MHASAPSRRPESTEGQPFTSAEQAWFWTINALRARREGGGANGGAVRRNCDPDDVIKCLDQLYRHRRIDLEHARILRVWGERQIAPNPRLPRECGPARLWDEAMERLAWPLRMKGIVVADDPMKDLGKLSLTALPADG